MYERGTVGRTRLTGVRLHLRRFAEGVCLRKVQSPIGEERTERHHPRPRSLHRHLGDRRRPWYRPAYGYQHRSLAQPVGSSRTRDHHAAGDWLSPAPRRIAAPGRRPFSPGSVSGVWAVYPLEVRKGQALSRRILLGPAIRNLAPSACRLDPSSATLAAPESSQLPTSASIYQERPAGKKIAARGALGHI